ncbi:hypothetical protein [Pajaroellobacter abortibovis]|uniref:Uncharacterized protein n=1 Tax=Pajaroellobacter abortibovis TaxID=1882918 RepID=A0A1L6MWC3_9BACT|nr:hypothetical protein [Pajaroellobacter abortibovis]APR99849.1 hypothetical protein BCY86_03530 [Pajaroellobacter abortibovis]
MLSSTAHGRLNIVSASLSTAKDRDDKRSRLYVDLVLASLNQKVKAALEKLRNSGQYEYQSECVK